jgi:pectate lyase
VTGATAGLLAIALVGCGSSHRQDVTNGVGGSVFDNYYFNNTTGSCVDSRMGAVVKAEGNYFSSSKNTIGWFEGPATGYWDVGNNVFLNCTGAQPTTSTGQLMPPYTYIVDDPNGLPTSIVAGAGVGKL